MTRVMIDVTHKGFPAALRVIDLLPAGDIVALYDTGSPDIAATPGDIAQIPKTLHTVFIDQGFTHSPNFNATVRDCENGAWSIPRAVNKTGWNVPRPTLYLGFPDTAQAAFNAGWRGDVWLVRPSSVPPTSPPIVPKGLNVVAVQWQFGTAFDRSVVFDATWPGVKMPTATPKPPPGQWTNPGFWEWSDAEIIGTGLDGKLHSFTFDPITGEWTKVS